MDHQRAMRRLRDPSILQKAFGYAIYDRRHSDFFFDPFEIECAVAHRDELICELIEELREPARYSQRPAFAYFPPKDELCDRRLIYIPIKDLILRLNFARISYSSGLPTSGASARVGLRVAASTCVADTRYLLLP